MLKCFRSSSFASLAAVLLGVLVGLTSCEKAKETETARIAVAANFILPAEELAAEFALKTGKSVELVSGSTGKLYAQIVNGAPYDAFLAADRERPEKLSAGNYTAGDPFPYAHGSLVALGPSYASDALTDWKQLSTLPFQHLAIANPDLAPYGKAAVEALEHSGQYGDVEGRIVRGENIAQTFHFVSSGSAELGIVARSQWISDQEKWKDSLAIAIPGEAHAPIEQCAVLLTDSPVAAEFLSFLRSESARALIRRSGYKIP